MKDKFIPFVTADTLSKVKHVTHGLTFNQKRLILTELGNTCYILLAHYLEKVNAKSFDFTDAHIGKELGFTERTVKRARLILTRHGLFYQCTVKPHNLKSIRITIIGEKSVRKFKEDSTKAISEIMNNAFSIDTSTLNIQVTE